MPNPNHRPWTKAEYALLGTMPDRELAKKIGRTYAAVNIKRNWDRIPSYERVLEAAQKKKAGKKKPKRRSSKT